MAKRFVVPFAATGDKSVTPDATDPAGAISYSQGWGAQYQLPDTDPSYRPVGRQEMNGVLNDITGAIAEMQQLGFPEWVAVTGLVTPYAINAVVRHSDLVWRNTVANNSAEPGVGAGWVSAILEQATESVLGSAKVATQAQTNTGTDDTTIVTPKKMRWGVTYSLGVNSYITLPSWLGSVILQWGSVSVVSTGQTVPFPISFSNVNAKVVCNVSDPSLSVLSTLGGITATGFGVRLNTAGTFSLSWFAIGF